MECKTPPIISITNMNAEFLTISKIDGKIQYLRDILPNGEIPTNTILRKTLTGIGATYSEIKANRNSIIIEPNVPVIIGKSNNPVHSNDNVFGVYEGICTSDLEIYIHDSQVKNKIMNILTTPESFQKVLDAFNSFGIDIRFDNYFLLFDECQKIIKDCDYRSQITLPLNYFFQCRHKALVSATVPNDFTDKRFNDFTQLTICPNFDYKKDVNIVTTNNILQSMGEQIGELNKDQSPIFIFVNSTDIILSLMRQLDIESQSTVFCSSKSVEKLRAENFLHAYRDWNQEKMAKYNFMTSRFYSALDIEIEEKPDVVLLTDCYIAEYTMFNPYLDTVQIIGRFRNGVKKIFHVSNTDKNIPIRSHADIMRGYEIEKHLYMVVKTWKDNACNDVERGIYNANLMNLRYNNFLDEDGKECYFLIDNYLENEIVKSYYNEPDRLISSYLACGYFNVKHKNHVYSINDTERIKIKSKTKTTKEKRREIVKQLCSLDGDNTKMASDYKRNLFAADPQIYKAYFVLGKEKIEECEYSITKIKKAIILKKHHENINSADVIRMVNNSFYCGKWYPAKVLKKGLRNIFEELEIPHPKAITSHNIKDYFEAFEQKRHEGRGYYLVNPKYLTT